MSIVLYNFFLWLYQVGIRIISPWNRKAAAWVKGRKGVFAAIRAAGIKGSQRVWMHCASLGEFEQGRPVIESLRKIYPDVTIIISFFSPSGYEIRKNYAGANHIFYLPMDSPGHAKRFLDLVNPSLVLWVKYDYWYYYLRELRRRKIPVLLVSPLFREDQPFFKWYGNIHRLMLDSFHAFFVQNQRSAELLETLGITRSVFVSGDTRFDRVIDIAEAFEPLPVIAAFCADHPVIVAGSTWEEDEEELDHFANTHPDIRFIIAPHEIEADHLSNMESLFRHSIRYSDLEKQFKSQTTGIIHVIRDTRAPNVLIIDNIGMLSRLYYYARICYVGGGFGDDGVHNTLEAAVYGKPVITGPVIDKYIEVMDLAESGGVIIIDNALEAESVFNRLLEDEKEYSFHGEAARAFVYARRGATEKIIRYIQEKRLL
ncbi:MAG TPA: 3-deoxy-D-manno-octulosonic acid transferase, partial [Chitinophagaceae bacterium]|nr:3-deoxy-D-manno-octulosonic acid transferase [Chitinophagaceae bacterium]